MTAIEMAFPRLSMGRNYNPHAVAFRNHHPPGRAGVSWDGIHFETPVIPAKAGIYFASLWKCTADGMDSRLRGNDGALERPCLANDTNTRQGKARKERREKIPLDKLKTYV